MAIQVECRSCVLVETHEVDGEGKCPTCANSKVEDVTVCDGCEADEEVEPEPIGLAKYLVTFHDGGSQICVYCTDCADLAKVDYNGETRSIEAA